MHTKFLISVHTVLVFSVVRCSTETNALLYYWLCKRNTRDVCFSFCHCIFYVGLVSFGPMSTEN